MSLLQELEKSFVLKHLKNKKILTEDALRWNVTATVSGK